MTAIQETDETTQPWIIWRYGATHDLWWPFWNSTRFLGYARIDAECIVCGHSEALRFRIPRFGPIPEPESGRHPARERFCADHAHPDRGEPMSWARPLRNPAAFSDGINLDALAMRLEADMNERDQ